jgi:uncharacterized protein (TIGR02145 family)/uncharacterized repeat protein (TIGR02543 family)
MAVSKRFTSGRGVRANAAISKLICLLAAAAFLLACESAIPDNCGDGQRFNPATQFCFDGRAYDKCGGMEYDPRNHTCEGGVLKNRCGSGNVWYDPITQFCHAGTVHQKCAGNEYNPANQTCDNGIVKTRCGESYFNPETEFCSGNIVYQRCGGSVYNPVTQGCVGNVIRERCDDGNFAPPGFNCDGTSIITYTLTLSRNPAAGGTIFVNNAETAGATTHNAGMQVTVRVEAAAGYTFTRWSGASTSTEASITLTMNSDQTLTANFQQQLQGQTYTLTTSVTPTGGGTVTRSPDQERFNAGTVVTVTAAPNQGYRFTRWSGASTTTNAEVTVTMNANLTLTAQFSPAYTLTVNANPAAGGTIFVNNTASTGASAHTAGTQLTIRAEASHFYRFTGWTGSAASANATLTVNMNSNLTFTANFTGGQFNPDVTYSSFTDERDGQSYRTVRIGDLTWMAENLNYAGHILGISACYGNNASNCERYGRLYDWDAAMGACPAGWRLPTDADWNDLVTTAGGANVAGGRLKSRGGWSSTGNGTDEFGFSALPGGTGWSSGFRPVGSWGYWWSASECGTSCVWYQLMFDGTSGVGRDAGNKADLFSVRCVQD